MCVFIESTSYGIMWSSLNVRNRSCIHADMFLQNDRKVFDISIDLGLLGITELRSGGNSLKPYTLFEHCVTLATCHTAPIHTQPSITYLSHRDRRTVSKDASISPVSVGTARAAGRGRCVSDLVPSILTERTSFPLDRRTEFSRASVVRTMTCLPSSRQVCDCVRARR